MATKHSLIKNDIGRPVLETFENEYLTVTNYLLTGETEVEFKPNCDPKIKEAYKILTNMEYSECIKLYNLFFKKER